MSLRNVIFLDKHCSFVEARVEHHNIGNVIYISVSTIEYRHIGIWAKKFKSDIPSFLFIFFIWNHTTWTSTESSPHQRPHQSSVHVSQRWTPLPWFHRSPLGRVIFYSWVFLELLQLQKKKNRWSQKVMYLGADYTKPEVLNYFLLRCRLGTTYIYIYIQNFCGYLSVFLSSECVCFCLIYWTVIFLPCPVLYSSSCW